MYRRQFVVATALGTGLLAGFLGGGEQPPTSPEQGTAEPTVPSSSGGSEPGSGFEMVVEPSATAINYGDPYSLTLTATNRADESEVLLCQVLYQTEETDVWDLLFTVNPVQLAPGESVTRTFDVHPPSTGAVQFAIGDDQRNVVDTWSLDVSTPELILSEPLYYYDGLAVSVDIPMFAEALETVVTDLHDETYRMERPVYANPGRQFAVVEITLENTMETEDLPTPHHRDVSLLVDGEQFERVWGEQNKFDLDDLGGKGFKLATLSTFDPPGLLVPSAKSTETIVFDVDAEADPVDSIVMVDRDDMRARWLP